MRVFVAGATGAVGSRLIRLLVSSGHSVVGLTHTAARADAIQQAGAEAAVADALNRAAIVAAVTSAKPDVIVHEMTYINAANDLRPPPTACEPRASTICWRRRNRLARRG